MAKGTIYYINEKDIASKEALERWMGDMGILTAICETENPYCGKSDLKTMLVISGMGDDILYITDKKVKDWNRVFFIQ